MITELLRLAKHYNNEIFKGTCSNILVFLRDDIKKKIEANYPDTAKLFSSYEIKLDWYDHQTFKVDENATNLKSFINRRIELNFQKNDISYDKTNPWSTLIPNDIDEYQNKSSFKYLIDFTFYRPRDLILFFSIVGHKDYQYPLHPKIVKALLKKYIYSNIVEIKNELSLNFSPNEIQTLFYDVFPYIIQNNRLTKSKLIEKLKDYEFDMDNNKVFELIEDYNLIAFKSPQGNLYFGHREDKLNEDERESYFLILPKCIFHHYTEIN